MIRWPLVSREYFEAEVAIARHAMQFAQENYNALLDKYHALKLQGAVAVPAPPEPQPAPEREPSIVAQVIREQSGGDPRLAAHLRTYAGKLRREGNSPEEIAFALGQWISTEPDISLR